MGSISVWYFGGGSKCVRSSASGWLMVMTARRTATRVVIEAKQEAWHRFGDEMESDHRTATEVF